MQDKRRHSRVPVNLPVSCEVPNQGSIAGTLVDISMGGAYISAPGTFAFGAEIAIIFDLPGVRSARLPAVVRWSKPGGFGVQFGLLGARETHALSTLIQAAKR